MALFASIAIMGESPVFSWDLRSPLASAFIASHVVLGLETKSGGAEPGESEGLTLDVMLFDRLGAIQRAFAFETEIGKGQGTARGSSLVQIIFPTMPLLLLALPISTLVEEGHQERR
jgi:hypothetical protein